MLASISTATFTGSSGLFISVSFASTPGGFDELSKRREITSFRDMLMLRERNEMEGNERK
jgi:hypothetical protein